MALFGTRGRVSGGGKSLILLGCVAVVGSPRGPCRMVFVLVCLCSRVCVF